MMGVGIMVCGYKRCIVWRNDIRIDAVIFTGEERPVNYPRIRRKRALRVRSVNIRNKLVSAANRHGIWRSP
jgi:hypothetical protein